MGLLHNQTTPHLELCKKRWPKNNKRTLFLRGNSLESGKMTYYLTRHFNMRHENVEIIQKGTNKLKKLTVG